MARFTPGMFRRFREALAPPEPSTSKRERDAKAEREQMHRIAVRARQRREAEQQRLVEEQARAGQELIERLARRPQGWFPGDSIGEGLAPSRLSSRGSSGFDSIIEAAREGWRVLRGE